MGGGGLLCNVRGGSPQESPEDIIFLWKGLLLDMGRQMGMILEDKAVHVR